MSSTPSNSGERADSAGSPDILMCILSYLGVFALIPFFVKKDDPFISWHARQGVLMMIVWFALFAVLFVLSLIPVIRLITLPLYVLLGLGMIGLSIYCIVQAYQGNKWPIPVLNQFMGRLPTVR